MKGYPKGCSWKHRVVRRGFTFSSYPIVACWRDELHSGFFLKWPPSCWHLHSTANDSKKELQGWIGLAPGVLLAHQGKPGSKGSSPRKSVQPFVPATYGFGRETDTVLTLSPLNPKPDTPKQPETLNRVATVNQARKLMSDAVSPKP